MNIKIDDFDRRILSALQSNARLTASELGEACGLSPTAALRRQKRLRADGVITDEVAVVSPEAVGQPLIMLALINLERERRDIIEAFKKSIRETPQIMQGFYVTGDSDFVLTISAQSMDDYETFTQSFLYDQHNIKSFKTLVVLDPVKMGSKLPIK